MTIHLTEFAVKPSKENPWTVVLLKNAWGFFENLASGYQMKMVSLMTGDLVLAVADQRSLLALAVAD